MKYKVNYIEDEPRMWAVWYNTGATLSFKTNNLKPHFDDKSIIILSVEVLDGESK